MDLTLLGEKVTKIAFFWGFPTGNLQNRADWGHPGPLQPAKFGPNRFSGLSMWGKKLKPFFLTHTLALVCLALLTFILQAAQLQVRLLLTSFFIGFNYCIKMIHVASSQKQNTLTRTSLVSSTSSLIQDVNMEWPLGVFTSLYYITHTHTHTAYSHCTRDGLQSTLQWDSSSQTHRKQIGNWQHRN